MSQFSRLCSNTRFFSAQPNRRDNVAFASRRDAARRERDGTGTVCQINNGDPDLAAMFHKSLPHDGLGQVLYKSYAPSASHFGGVSDGNKSCRVDCLSTRNRNPTSLSWISSLNA